MKSIVVCSGGFDPLHSGHINYLKSAAKLGDVLIVGLNSDFWLRRKKGQEFLSWEERAAIIRELKFVDHVEFFNDEDNTAIKLIEKVKQKYPNDYIIFANGGDRTKENIPEMVFEDVCFEFGVGGENKKNSSSWILAKWKDKITVRSWGKYKVLSEVEDGVKVKELIIDPYSSLSMQKHKYRNEIWFVAKGSGKIKSEHDILDLELFNEYFVKQGSWHQLINHTSEPLHIVEIQYGEKCIEEDIIRL